jgi:methionyl-tRNA formyltransferase
MTQPLRIVAFNVLPRAYEAVAEWAAANGHQIVLLVTPPRVEEGRYGAGAPSLLQVVPPGQDVLVTSRLRKTAAPVIAALRADLVISAAFPLRIPPEVTAVPRFGAINLHPAPLPRGRGANPVRLIYDGDLTAAGTVHRIEPEFDAGPVLSLHTRRLPDDLSPELILGTWRELLLAALNDAVRRAVAGEYGDPQDESQASFPAPFTEEERVLRWDEPGFTIQRRAAALNLFGPTARTVIDGQELLLLGVRAHPGPAPDAPPGTVLARDNGRFTIRVPDGVVTVEARAP